MIEGEDSMSILRTWLLPAAAAAALGCSSSTSPNNGGNGGNGGGNGAGGGPVGAVTVGNLFFQSAHNGTTNPAVDTVPVGQAVTWTWTGTGSTTHSVESLGSPSFTSSNGITGNGMVYTFTFTQPGTYRYECAFHPTIMSGTVVVQ
jgi:plastocyanin